MYVPCAGQERFRNSFLLYFILSKTCAAARCADRTLPPAPRRLGRLAVVRSDSCLSSSNLAVRRSSRLIRMSLEVLYSFPRWISKCCLCNLAVDVGPPRREVAGLFQVGLHGFLISWFSIGSSAPKRHDFTLAHALAHEKIEQDGESLPSHVYCFGLPLSVLPV